MPRFPTTYCSQCGAEFGPGDAGFSHCKDHMTTDTPAAAPAAYDPNSGIREMLKEHAEHARKKGKGLVSYIGFRADEMTREELLDLVACLGDEMDRLRNSQTATQRMHEFMRKARQS